MHEYEKRDNVDMNLYYVNIDNLFHVSCINVGG